MFKRRKGRSFFKKLRESIWPSMGWWRVLQYFKHRTIRLSDSSEKIAAGLALGTAASFSPLMGTHIIQAGIAAYVIRANLLASVIGTAIGNPWTFPFIWWASYSLGAFCFGYFGWHGPETLPDNITTGTLWELIKTQPLDIFLPWMFGGYVLAVIVGFSSFFLYDHLIAAARKTRARMIERKQRKKAKQQK